MVETLYKPKTSFTNFLTDHYAERSLQMLHQSVVLYPAMGIHPYQGPLYQDGFDHCLVNPINHFVP